MSLFTLNLVVMLNQWESFILLEYTDVAGPKFRYSKASWKKGTKYLEGASPR